MPPRSQRNFRLRKELSVRVIKAWLELLRLEDGVLTWGYWDTDQRTISEIFDKYNLSECMGINAPTRTSLTCETLLKSTELYLSQSDIDRSLYEWIRALEDEEDGENEMRQKVEALIQIGQEEGVKSVVAEKSKSLLCMLEFMTKKPASGEEVLRAHEIFIPLQHSALRTRDAGVREELSR